MVSKAKLSPEAYERQISGLVYPESKGAKAKNYNVAVKVDLATKNKIKEVPNWQDKLRSAIDRLIEEERERAEQQQNTA